MSQPSLGSSLLSVQGLEDALQGLLRGPQPQGPSSGASGGGKGVQQQTPRKAMRAGQRAVGSAAALCSHGDTGPAGGGGENGPDPVPP